MLKRGKLDRGIMEMVDLEGLVPPEHLLRKIDAAVNFDELYAIVEGLYSEDQGRPSVDPVVLFKMVLIEPLYGLGSLRRTAEEVSVNVAYRWFLGYPLQEETPHFSTVSYNFRHRFTAETVEEIFAWILSKVAQAGYLSPKAVFIDGTHIKANANTKKKLGLFHLDSITPGGGRYKPSILIPDTGFSLISSCGPSRRIGHFHSKRNILHRKRSTSRFVVGTHS